MLSIEETAQLNGGRGELLALRITTGRTAADAGVCRCGSRWPHGRPERCPELLLCGEGVRRRLHACGSGLLQQHRLPLPRPLHRDRLWLYVERCHLHRYERVWRDREGAISLLRKGRRMWLWSCAWLRKCGMATCAAHAKCGRLQGHTCTARRSQRSKPFRDMQALPARGQTRTRHHTTGRIVRRAVRVRF